MEAKSGPRSETGLWSIWEKEKKKKQFSFVKGFLLLCSMRWSWLHFRWTVTCCQRYRVLEICSQETLRRLEEEDGEHLHFYLLMWGEIKKASWSLERNRTRPFRVTTTLSVTSLSPCCVSGQIWPRSGSWFLTRNGTRASLSRSDQDQDQVSVCPHFTICMF